MGLKPCQRLLEYSYYLTNDRNLGFIFKDAYLSTIHGQATNSKLRIVLRCCNRLIHFPLNPQVFEISCGVVEVGGGGGGGVGDVSHAGVVQLNTTRHKPHVMQNQESTDTVTRTCGSAPYRACFHTVWHFIAIHNISCMIYSTHIFGMRVNW